MATTPNDFARHAADVAASISLGKAVADMGAYEARGAAKAAHGAILTFIAFGVALEDPALKPLTELQSEAWNRRADLVLEGAA